MISGISNIKRTLLGRIIGRTILHGNEMRQQSNYLREIKEEATDKFRQKYRVCTLKQADSYCFYQLKSRQRQWSVYKRLLK